MVMDGDFKTQLRRNLRKTKNLDKTFALRALQDDKFAVYKTYMDYLQAGAQIIRTNTYNLSKVTIRKYLNLSEDEIQIMIHSAVQLAKQAVSQFYEKSDENPALYKFMKQRPLVAGACSNYNTLNFDDEIDIIKDIHNLSSKFLIAIYKERVQMMLDAGVDLLAFESIPSFKEAEAILDVLKIFSTARAWITFLCKPDGNLLDGASFAMVALYCYRYLPDNIIAIGAMCVSHDKMKILMEDIEKKELKIPFVFYTDDCHLCIKKSDDKIKVLKDNFVKEWLDNGVRYISGGVGTVAENISEISKQVKNYCQSKCKIFTLLKACSYKDTANRSKL